MMSARSASRTNLILIFSISALAMDSSPQATQSLIAMRSELDNASSGLVPSDDQCFLIYFIMGAYFGPDLRGQNPPKSALQRLAEGLPSYTFEHLANSQIKTAEVQRIYYYILRKADQSLVVKQHWLHKFLHGNLSSTTCYPQFPDLFPSRFHTQLRSKKRHRIIKNIVFINNPEIFYIKHEDVERFKRLTGLEDFLVDGDAARVHNHVNDEILNNVAVHEEDKSNVELPTPLSNLCTQRTRPLTDFLEPKDDIKPASNLPLCNGIPMTYSNMAPLPIEVDTGHMERCGPGMIFLPSVPTMEEWGNIVTATKSGSALTGSAAMGQIGPVIGLIDIGECEDSYLFRVSLPGVKRDEREFSCEVENDGKVLIRGVTTTGQKTVHRYTEVFEMKSQNLCPPGHFSISFKLPGPVDPQQFSGNFGTDGILEGIVMKGRQRRE